MIWHYQLYGSGKNTRKYGYPFIEILIMLPRLVNAGFPNLDVRLGKYPMAVSILGCTAKIPVTTLLDDVDGFSDLKLEAQFALFFKVEDSCKKSVSIFINQRQ